jgi:hypothetical protein
MDFVSGQDMWSGSSCENNGYKQVLTLIACCGCGWPQAGFRCIYMSMQCDLVSCLHAEYAQLGSGHSQDDLQLAHQRGAHHLLSLCFRNGGSYIKLAQHIGTLVRRSTITVQDQSCSICCLPQIKPCRLFSDRHFARRTTSFQHLM